MVKLILCEQANGGETIRLMGPSHADPLSVQKVGVLFTSLRLFNVLQDTVTLLKLFFNRYLRAPFNM